jgi:hypothetical protein
MVSISMVSICLHVHVERIGGELFLDLSQQCLSDFDWSSTVSRSRTSIAAFVRVETIQKKMMMISLPSVFA